MLKFLGLHGARSDRRTAAFTLNALASQLTGAAHGFSLLASALFGGLFVVYVALHFAEGPFTLHLLLQSLEGLIDVIVADKNLYQRYLSIQGSVTDSSEPASAVA